METSTNLLSSDSNLQSTRFAAELPTRTSDIGRDKTFSQVRITRELPTLVAENFGSKGFLQGLKAPVNDADEAIAIEFAAGLRNSLATLAAPIGGDTLLALLISGQLGPVDNTAHFIGWAWQVPDCEPERRAVQQASQTYRTAEQAVQQTQKELDQAEQERKTAQQELSKAARDVESARDAEASVIAEFPFNLLASMYVAAFSIAHRRARRKFQDALTNERNIIQLLRLREQNRDAALAAYLAALVAWILCLVGF
ncbi:MAG: hypothetical protein ACR2RB_15725 [Gammaproteobacteria bacterium]